MCSGKWLLAWFLAVFAGGGAALGSDVHVAVGGSDADTGADWAHALASISNGVAKAGSSGTVWVGSGSYSITNEIVIAAGVRVAGTNGLTQTYVLGPANTSRVFRLMHADAVLEGFTISRGGVAGDDKRGAGVFVSSGLLRNCLISNNVPTNSAVLGAGVFLCGGAMTNCLIVGNTAVGALGAGVYVSNALVAQCSIWANGGTQSGILGGGVYAATNGVVSNCFIRLNRTSGTGCGGGGAYVAGGRLVNCTLAGNVVISGAWGTGGGVCMTGGRVENCLVVSNWANGTMAGGGITMAGGAVVHCTIVANRSRGNGIFNYPTTGMTSSGAGIQYGTGYDSNNKAAAGGGVVSNSIIAFNMRSAGMGQCNIGGATVFTNAFRNSCSPDLGTGTNGNINADPLFYDWKNGDFRLLPYSPCVDVGASIGPGTDLADAARPQDGRGAGSVLPDLGCYERPAAASAFTCWFQAATNEAFDSLTADFTASVFGPSTNGLTYVWNFGDGAVESSAGPGITHAYAGRGVYTVSLAVTNGLSESASWTVTNAIRIGAAYAYVSTNGSHTFPFDTWPKAATSILAAVNAGVVTTGGATRVVVSNGVYSVPNATASVVVSRGMTVASLNGATSVTVYGTSGSAVYPVIDVDHPDAVVDGFTVTNSNIGVQLHRGTVRNCVLRHNSGSIARPNGFEGNYGGAGVGATIYGGVMENCQVISNTTAGTTAHGAGLFLTGGAVVRNCVIAYNRLPGANSSGFGAGVAICDATHRAVLRNCLVYSNELGLGSYTGVGGGGVGITGGRIENCTIVSNNVNITVPGGAGGGIFVYGGTSVNTIIWNNTLSTNTINNITGSHASISFSCASELTNTLRGCVNADPLFMDPTQGNWCLQAASPCVNTGTNLVWMEGALDLAGRSRIIGRRVDMGAYETKSVGAILLVR